MLLTFFIREHIVMSLIGAVLIVLLMVLIYVMVYHTSGAELFGVANPVDPPAVYYFGDFQDPQRFTIGMIGGVHGNEPAGSVALQELIGNGWFTRTARENINFVVIPRANEYGLTHNQRWTKSLLQPDLNRSFHERYINTPANGNANLPTYILEAFANTNLVMDLHEGWGWHKINNSSIGSTLSPTRINGDIPLEQISRDIVETLNADISDPQKHFTSLDNISCDILSSLSCYMERRGRYYILMETTGQKNIQPMRVRVSQMHKAVEKLVGDLINHDFYRS